MLCTDFVSNHYLIVCPNENESLYLKFLLNVTFLDSLVITCIINSCIDIDIDINIDNMATSGNPPQKVLNYHTDS